MLQDTVLKTCIQKFLSKVDMKGPVARVSNQQVAFEILQVQVVFCLIFVTRARSWGSAQSPEKGSGSVIRGDNGFRPALK
jgi:hypothetical protein